MNVGHGVGSEQLFVESKAFLVVPRSESRNLDGIKLFKKKQAKESPELDEMTLNEFSRDGNCVLIMLNDECKWAQLDTASDD